MSEDEIKKIKIYGETAIPAGTYKVIMNVVSEKFKNRVWAKPVSYTHLDVYKRQVYM